VQVHVDGGRRDAEHRTGLVRAEIGQQAQGHHLALAAR
jgi:hypothetical protein